MGPLFPSSRKGGNRPFWQRLTCTVEMFYESQLSQWGQLSPKVNWRADEREEGSVTGEVRQVWMVNKGDPFSLPLEPLTLNVKSLPNTGKQAGFGSTCPIPRVPP